MPQERLARNVALLRGALRTLTACERNYRNLSIITSIARRPHQATSSPVNLVSAGGLGATQSRVSGSKRAADRSLLASAIDVEEPVQCLLSERVLCRPTRLRIFDPQRQNCAEPIDIRNLWILMWFSISPVVCRR